MNSNDFMAVETLKTLAARDPRLVDGETLRAFLEAKGFDLKSAVKLAKETNFGEFFRQLVLRSKVGFNDVYIDDLVINIRNTESANVLPYSGHAIENQRIDTALANSGISEGTTKFFEGAATAFVSRSKVPEFIAGVPICVIGQGAAGILVANALARMGFTRVTVLEKAKPLGIWDHRNVYSGSRNNPALLTFYNEQLAPAPGSGEEVRDFLVKLQSGFTSTTAMVTGVRPGRLHQRIFFSNGRELNWPIVINATGLGRPKPVSDQYRMTTNSEKHAGLRWQIQLNADDNSKERIVLIGLGNSTAEMLRQIHDLNDEGAQIDYRILTHYPKPAVADPNRYRFTMGNVYRVFRDLSRPNLVDYQGDLPLSRYDYFRALHAGKIITGVRRWEVESPGEIEVFSEEQTEPITWKYSKIMTLIGYGQSSDVMQAMGCQLNDGVPAFDYDGEMALEPGEADPNKRLAKGYFGFGSILETPSNPNAIVIPGMLHRLGDLAFGVVMRATEYVRTPSVLTQSQLNL